MLSDSYAHDEAVHYAAYRPPVHGTALARLLPAGARFGLGVDVGAGTGHSTHALLPYCDVVVGVEPSAWMREAALPHERIVYADGTAEALPVAPRSADLVAFAGVLPYANRLVALGELRRVCRPGAWVVVYDVEVALAPALERLGMALPNAPAAYDHAANFDGVPGFDRLAGGTERVRVEATPAQLAHLLLSDAGRRAALAARFGPDDPFPALAELLALVDARPALDATLHYAAYRLV